MISNEPRELIGKTIVGVTDHEADWYEATAFTLHFSDGTSARLQPVGYEADGIQIELDSYTGRMRRGAIAAGRREAERVRRLAGMVYRRRRQEAEAHAKATLSPEAFEQWKREHDPHHIIKSIWGEEMCRQLYTSSALLELVEGRFEAGDGTTVSIPVKREAASDDS